MSERDRIAEAKRRQAHDADPPRCATCVYFRREPHQLYADRTSRSGRQIRVKVKAHPKRNPLVERCSFGNFEVRPHHVCDEWKGRNGDTLEPPSGEVSP